MKISEIVPPAEYHAPFDLYSLKRIDDCAGCYCLTNASRDIIYIGQAKSIRNRAIQHFSGSKKAAMTIYGRISQMWWRAEAATLLNALERGWLESFRLLEGKLPPLNQSSAPI